MNKGLTKTLLTVAVALLGYQAMSMAPTISAIPDVIIGDAEEGSGSNRFVFPDAIPLGNYVNDDTTSDGAIIWSADSATGHYAINLKPSLGAGDPNAPGTAALTSGTDDGDSVDSDLQTATFRNVQFSPTAGTDGADPGFTGIGAGEVLTLYASDGTTYSSREMMVYIDAGGEDAISGSNPGEVIYDVDFSTGVSGWSSYTDLAIGGTVTQTQGASGLCVDTSAAGVNIAGWQSEPNAANFSSFDLVNNAVYQVRLSVTTTAALGNTPLWTVIYEQAQTLYGGDSFFFDNFGGANSPSPNSSRTTFEAWVSPVSAITPQWQAGAFTGAAAAENDFRLKLRILDVDGAGYGAETDAGQICWKTIEVMRHDIPSMTVASNVYNVTNFVQAPADITTPNPDQYTVTDYFANSTIGYGASITLTPNGTAWQDTGSFIQITPGDTTFPANIGNQADVTAELPDNYPIPWEADTLYRLTVDMSTPTASDATNAVDFIFIGVDTFSNELIKNAYVTPKYGAIGTPNTTSAPFTMFFYSHSVSAGDFNEFKTFRPKIQLGCNDSFLDTTNTGAIKIDGISVDKMN